MTDTFSLPRLEPGFSAIIAQLTAQGEMRRRLQDMGFIPGTTVASATLPHTGYGRQS